MTRHGPDKDVAHFARRSANYGASWTKRHSGRLHRKMLRQAARVAGQPRSVLDVGCGTGQLLRKASALWPLARLVGVDPAEGRIEAARRELPAAVFFLAGTEVLPVPDASIDVAFSSLSVHHGRDQLMELKEIARTLRPGGCLCLAHAAPPLATAQALRILGPLGEAIGELLRLRFKYREPVLVLMTDAGFSVLAQETALAGSVLLTIGKR